MDDTYEEFLGKRNRLDKGVVLTYLEAARVAGELAAAEPRQHEKEKLLDRGDKLLYSAERILAAARAKRIELAEIARQRKEANKLRGFGLEDFDNEDDDF